MLTINGMEINIVLIAVILILLGGGIKGYSRGMIEELSSAVALVLSLVAIAMFATGAKGYITHETLRTIMGIVCFTIAVLVYKIVDFILSSIKVIAKLPIIHGLDKILGFAVGMIEALVLIWIVFIIVVAFDLGGYNSIIISNINQSRILVYLFQNNYIAEIISGEIPVIKLPFSL